MSDIPLMLAQKQTAPVPVQIAPKPAPVPLSPAATPPPPPPAQITSTGVTKDHIGELPFNGFDLGVIAGITILIALVALIPKGLITRHLVSHRATPNAAGLAAWFAWFFIVVTAVFLLVGTLGHWWTVIVFTATGGATSLLLLFATIVFFSKAQHTHR